jgi:hypothetical protein
MSLRVECCVRAEARTSAARLGTLQEKRLNPINKVNAITGKVVGLMDYGICFL